MKQPHMASTSHAAEADVRKKGCLLKVKVNENTLSGVCCCYQGMYTHTVRKVRVRLPYAYRPNFYTTVCRSLNAVENPMEVACENYSFMDKIKLLYYAFCNVLYIPLPTYFRPLLLNGWCYAAEN